MKNVDKPALTDGGKGPFFKPFEYSFYAFVVGVIVLAVVFAVVEIYLVWQLGALLAVIIVTLPFLVRAVIKFLVARPSWFSNRSAIYRALQKTHRGMEIFHKLYVFLHQLHGRALKYVGAKFMDMEQSSQIAIGGALTVVCLIGFLGISYETVEIVRTKLPYGKNRFQMTAEELALRKANRIQQSGFAVWGKKGSIKAAECMDKQFKTLVYAEAVKNSITPERFEGLLMVEAFCDPTKVNGGDGPKGSGAAGLGQIMLDVGCERKLVMDQAFCSKVYASDGNLRFIPKGSGIEDRRLQPQFSVPVSADILGDGKRYWGDENWAFVEYHMGVGNLRNLVMDYLDETNPGWRSKYTDKFSNKADPKRVIPREIQASKITYDDIYFRSTPDRTPKTYARLKSLKDSSSTYVYTGLAAVDGLDLMRSNLKAFQEMVAKQQDPDGGEANRPMRAWWGDKEARYNFRNDVLLASSSGELVAVKNSTVPGYVLRTSGADRIGQCDPGYESSYHFTRKATVGAIFLVASRVQEMGGDAYEVTGLIRTNEMYDKPFGKTRRGCLPPTQPRTHVIGVAFDIGANIGGKPMSKKTRDALEFVIMDLRADGLIDRIPEGKADHIAYNPAFEKELEDVYDRVMGGQSPLLPSSLVAQK